MSDHVAQSDHESAGTARQSMHHYQAAWMGHWKHASRKQSTEIDNHSLQQCALRDDHGDSKQHPLLSGPQAATNISKYDKGFRGGLEARTNDTVNTSLKLGSMKLGKKLLDGQPLSMFNFSGSRERAIASKNDAGTSYNSEAFKYQIDLNDGHNSIAMGSSEQAHPEMECPSRKRKYKAESTSWIPEQLVKSHNFLEKHSLPVSTSLGNDIGSSSKIVPYISNSGVAPMASFSPRKENSTQIVASKEHFTDAKICSYSTFWVHEKKADTLFESSKIGSSPSRQNGSPLLVHDQSTNKIQLCSFLNNKQNQRVENNSSIKLLPGLGSAEAIQSRKAYDEHLLLPSSVHDVQTMRICTTVDSMEEFPRGPSKFSKATHQFFITKKTGVNFSKGGQAFGETVSPQSKGNMFSEFLSLSPSFSFHAQQGAKLQPLGSTTDSEGNDNIGDVRPSAVCLKNESSVETDAMELDLFQKRQLSGVVLCPSDQNIKSFHNSSSSATKNANGDKMASPELPDMNERLPALPGMADSTDDRETSTSRTQSLDAEHLLSHAEQPSSSKTAACPDGSLELDPSSRWVKRLKPSISEPFAHGSKNSKMEEVTSHEKVNKMFPKISNCSKTSSEPTVGRTHVTPLPLNQTAMLLKNGGSTSSDSERKSQDIPLSQSWIHRWLRPKAAAIPNKKPETLVLCEPQSSNANLDELQKKQFPSIAAMALMGKAMNGFHPCEFKRTGSLIVWST